MPHYKDGSPAKVGDLVHSVPPYPTAPRLLGVLVSINPGTETCNGGVLPFARKFSADSPWYPMSAPFPDCVTLKECLPINTEEPVEKSLTA
ncbi:MAG TPA: hypothetical protein VGR34_06480 [Candidatus Dormibacteraeota bacterium]|nr:hypothetical protein [Candidatus Dormibacteraeota bacterium]